jgi:hypothetical protein
MRYGRKTREETETADEPCEDEEATAAADFRYLDVVFFFVFCCEKRPRYCDFEAVMKAFPWVSGN